MPLIISGSSVFTTQEGPFLKCLPCSITSVGSAASYLIIAYSMALPPVPQGHSHKPYNPQIHLDDLGLFFWASFQAKQ